MSWATPKTSINIRETALDDSAIDVGGKECLLKRGDRKALIESSVSQFNKMHERSLYSFEAEFVEIKESSITGDALSAKHLNDASAMSYVLKLVTERLQQYDLLNLFVLFPSLDLSKITTKDAWIDRFTDLFRWIDDLDIETVCMTVKWIRQFIDDDEWSRDLSWSRDILLKACTGDLKEAIMGEEDTLIAQDKAYQGGPVTLVLIIKRLSGLNSKALKRLYEYVAKMDLKSVVGEDVTKVTHQLRTILKRFSSCSPARFVLPPTCYEDIVAIFTTSSCEEFNTVFRALLTQHELGMAQFTYQNIFNTADELYHKHLSQWVPSESTQSGFVAKGNIICHNCGEPGHIARECPLPRKQSGGVDLGTEWFKPPDSNQAGCIKLSSDPNHWKKTIAGEEVWWCGICSTRKGGHIGRWTNGNRRHFTSEHRGNRQANNPVAANVATAEAPIAPPSTVIAASASADPAPHSVTFAEAITESRNT